MKRLNVFTIFFLALMLVIRPVFADSLMVSAQTESQVEISHTTIMHSVHAEMTNMADQSKHHHSMQHPMETLADSTCCNPGVHFCEMECNDGNCNILSAAPVVQIIEETPLFLVHPRIQTSLNKTTFQTRSISPELRPPLV